MRDMCSDIRVGNYIYRRLLPSSTSNLHFLIFFNVGGRMYALFNIN